MRSFLLIIVCILQFVWISQASAAKNEFFEKGKVLFEKKEYEKSKFFFEKELVFDPKSEKSYLYLAKIFKKTKDDQLQESNLKNVLLLNPQNDEAIYMLTILKIEHFNYEEAKNLMEQFNEVCKLFCSKKNEIKKKFNKLIPENEKDNN
tara:strand:+ start:64 stop:510 length:447 start_codon:yes stop_codon:yes gene_type:complete